MRRKNYCIVLFLLIFLKTLSADHSFDRCCYPSHIYIGADLLGASLNTSVSSFNVEGARCFGGIQVGYEYLKPGQFYTDIKILSTFSSHFNVSQNDVTLPPAGSVNMFGGFDVRFGYPFAFKKIILAPFLGICDYGFNPWSSNEGFSENFPALNGGVHFLYTLSTTFEIGLDVEIFGNVGGLSSHKRYAPHPWQNFDSSGGIFSLPFAWHFGDQGRWEACLQPLLFILAFSENQYVYGLAATLGRHF